MDWLYKLENSIEKWLRPIPHLPRHWRKWLAHNIWWVAFIAVILSLVGILVLFASIMFALLAVIDFHSMLSSLVSLAFMVATVAVLSMGINHLINMHRKGWEWLSLSFLIGVVYKIVNLIINFISATFLSNLMSIIFGTLLGGYLLFELRSYFRSDAPIDKK